MSTSQPTSSSFACSKWTIISVCFAKIYLVAFLALDVDYAAKGIRLLVLLAILWTMIELSGLIGAARESYPLSVAYLVWLIIYFVWHAGKFLLQGSSSAIGKRFVWLAVGLNLILIIVSGLFVDELRRFRHKDDEQGNVFPPTYAA